ncbi:MAG TPA: NUDIX hydrolase [Candidatus Levybacteria bacterium]|nr:NUDIX hydrolase [Candidatus Levybacteria bacterium]
MKHTNVWKKVSSKVVYTTPYFSISEDAVIQPNGNPGTYYVIDFKPSVVIFPLTTDNQVYLISIYRYPTLTRSWELPGGGTENKDFLTDAKRELKEETGLQAKVWKKLGKLQVFNGQSSEWMHIYCAKGITEGKNIHGAQEGIVGVKKFTWDEVITMIKTGEISDAQTIAALSFSATVLGFIHPTS